MKALRLIGLGIAIWGLGLLWPEINQLLTPQMTIGVALGLGAVTLAYVLVQRLERRHHNNGAGQDNPTRPVPVAMAR